jgi:carbamoyltransferase
VNIFVGLNTGHDSGASLILDDQIVAAVNEERFSRIKGNVGFPTESLKYLLEEYPEISSTKNKINIIVEGEKFLPWQKDVGDMDPKNLPSYRKLLDHMRISDFLLGSELGLKTTNKLVKISQLGKKELIGKQLSDWLNYHNLTFVDHHRAHAASALPFSELEDKSGISISFDAAGEGYCSRTHLVNRLGGLDEISKLALPCIHSPASYYAAITELCGFRANRHEGKITGLAASGNSENVHEILRNFLVKQNNWPYVRNKIGYGSYQLKKLRSNLNEFTNEDLAAGIQKLTEETIIHYFNRVIQELSGGISNKNYKNLYLSGGLFANVTLNRKIGELKISDRITIAPNMGDGGLSLGAAILGYQTHNQNKQVPTVGLPYLGPSIEKNEITEVDSVAVAKLLAQNKIVAFCRGRMEFGPRALGNRSILFPAWDPKINDWLNKKLKRSEFMPFAPIVRDVDFDKYFYRTSDIRDYRFMTLTTECTDLAIKQIPGVVHVDNSARPQVLFKEDNVFLYNVLSEFENQTGCGVLINTSFNMHEEPIVMNESQGFNSFKLSGINSIILGNELIHDI